MEFLEIPLFDDDFYKMVFRFALNIIFLTIIIRWLYYANTGRKNYLFTYYMIGVIVFFLCFTLKKYQLDLGMALGLFAIFGIIRYRTDPVDIKEMTYLFIIIGVSVINSLANSKMSYAEIIGGNVIIVCSIYIIEHLWLTEKTIRKSIEYTLSDKIKPENHHLLIEELMEVTGLPIEEVSIGNINLVSNTVKIKISYKPENL